MLMSTQINTTMPTVGTLQRGRQMEEKKYPYKTEIYHECSGDTTDEHRYFTKEDAKRLLDLRKVVQGLPSGCSIFDFEKEIRVFVEHFRIAWIDSGDYFYSPETSWAVFEKIVSGEWKTGTIDDKGQYKFDKEEEKETPKPKFPPHKPIYKG